MERESIVVATSTIKAMICKKINAAKSTTRTIIRKENQELDQNPVKAIIWRGIQELEQDLPLEQ